MVKLSKYIKFWNLQIVSPPEDVKRISFPGYYLRKYGTLEALCLFCWDKILPDICWSNRENALGIMDIDPWKYSYLKGEIEKICDEIDIHFKGGFIQEFIEIVMVVSSKKGAKSLSSTFLRKLFTYKWELSEIKPPLWCVYV